MLKRCAFLMFISGILTGTTANAITARGTTPSPAAAYNYNYMYPYMNNKMRTDLNPGVTPSQSGNPINVITKTEQLSTPRRVVPRTAARSAISTNSNVAAPTPQQNIAPVRRVVARSATRTAPTARSARGDVSTTSQNATNATNAATLNNTVNLTSTKCLADYTECMNGYCQRENTAYNRCYCSAKLAQIDAEYQPAIDSLIQKILRMQNTNAWSDAEMNEYWANTIGKYTGDNSLKNLDDALNSIDWAATESRVRGQQAFATGHEFCAQHLRGCAYMASNLRDAYRSEIARDCAKYESGLAKIKNAAESIVETYSD